MKCAGCGKVNPAGARYCVHCGAEQSVPTPIAAVAAAAMGGRAGNAVPQAANAAQADPAADHQPRSLPARERAPRPAGIASEPTRRLAEQPAAGGGPPAPAYAASPRRTGLAAALVAACLVVAVIAFAGWRMLYGDSRPGSEAANGRDDASVMSAFPPEATPQKERASAAAPAPPRAGATAPDAARIAARDSGSGVATRDGSASDPARVVPGAAVPTPAEPPVEIKPLPAKPAAKATRRAPVDKAPAATVAPPAAMEPVPVAPARPPVVAAAPRPSPVSDRWMKMSDELSRCTREDFITRVICDQRVRLRYCDGYWGKVAQCPGHPNPRDADRR